MTAEVGRRIKGLSALISGRRRAFSTLAVFFSTALWASSGIFVNFIMDGGAVSVVALAFYRDLGTFLVLLVGLGLFRPAMLVAQRRDLKWLWLMGGLCIGGFHVFWNLSVMLNGVAVATVQQSVSPILVTITAFILWREPLTSRKIIAVILSSAGTVLVSGLDVLGRTQWTATGLAAGTMMALLYGAFNIFGKRIAGSYHPLTVLTYAFGFATLSLLPLQFFVPQPWPVPVSSVLYLACLVLLPTVVGFTSYMWALRGLEASVASILAMAEIPVAYLYSYILLGERLTTIQIVGAVMVVVGVLLLSQRGTGQAGGDGDEGATTDLPVQVTVEEGHGQEGQAAEQDDAYESTGRAGRSV